MKHLKMLGLAAVAAMALMAFFGASSASAGVLCKTHQNHCSAGWKLSNGMTLTTSLTSGKQAVLKAAFSEVKCNSSHVAGTVTNEGGEGAEVEGEITELSFTECKCGERTAHVSVIQKGILKVNGAGTVTSTNTRATIQCTGLASCIYGTVASGTDIGTFTDSTKTGGAAELSASATLTWTSGEGDSGQFVCAGFGDTGTWTAEYVETGSTRNLWLATT